jgi:hypothetical protein
MKIEKIKITHIWGEVGEGVKAIHVDSIAQVDLDGTLHLPTQERRALKKLLKRLERDHIRRAPTSVEVKVVESPDALVLNLQVVFSLK